MLSVTANWNNQLSGYSYDASGNMLNDGVNTYTYDAENQITTVAGVTYTYDGDGDRVEKSNGKLYWYGDGANALDETDLSGNLTDEYIFFGGKRIARRDSSSNVDYYFADHLGSAHVVTNASGTIQDDSDFYPYGGERSYTSSSGNTRKFTGKERDSESGLDNLTARFYASTTGRFMSADDSKYVVAADPQTWNLYGYVANNPLNAVDPTGHAPNPPDYLRPENKYKPMQHSGGGPGEEFGGGGPPDSTIDSGTNSGSGTHTYQVLLTGGGEPNDIVNIEAISGQDAMAMALATADPDPPQQFVIESDPGETTVNTTGPASIHNNEQDIIYKVFDMGVDGKPSFKNCNHTLELDEKVLSGDLLSACTTAGACTGKGSMQDDMVVYNGSPHSVEKRFMVDGRAARLYDPVTKQSYDYAILNASFSANPKTNPPFTFEYYNNK
jgi:RHS repeat-associated protein